MVAQRPQLMCLGGTGLHRNADTCWRNGKMILRWAAAYLETEKHLGRIMGYTDLWMTESALRPDGKQIHTSNEESSMAYALQTVAA